MGTIKRLSDDDVRAIFESLHGNHMPPIHLDFKIVPVGPDGLRLSPPSYEFEDGLYVLLKPDKKRSRSQMDRSPMINESPPWIPDTSGVPLHLKQMIMSELPKQTCPWSLSGPQFPQPTAIQQRYCYPRGSENYASRKGGALWTMYDSTGKEDLMFRLLHVYFSAKRAVNKGVRMTQEERMRVSRQSPNSTPRRRPKQSPNSTPRRRRAAPKRFSPYSTPRRTIRATVTDSPFSAASSNKIREESTYDTPLASITEVPEKSIPDQPFQRIPSFELSGCISHNSTVQDSDYRILEQQFLSDDCTGDQNTFEEEIGHDMAQLFVDAESLIDLTSYWDDPLFGFINDTSSFQNENVCQALSHRLNSLHESISNLIMTTPEKKGPMINIVVDWARALTKAPLITLKNRATIRSKHLCSVVEDALICRLFETEGSNWMLMSAYIGRPAIGIEERHKLLKERFEHSVQSVNLTTSLVGQIQTMKQSHVFQNTKADVLILKHLADYIINGRKVTLDRDFNFGPFIQVISPGELCSRCGLLVPSFETGRSVCKRTGWCETCMCLSVCVPGDYIRQLHYVRKMATFPKRTTAHYRY